MPKFLYVACYASPFAALDDPPSFDHTVIEAENDEAAYEAGGRWFDTGYRDASLVNDYVIDLATVESKS